MFLWKFGTIDVRDHITELVDLQLTSMHGFIFFYFIVLKIIDVGVTGGNKVGGLIA